MKLRLNFQTRATALALLTGSAALVGCNDTSIDHAEAALTAHDNTEATVRGLSQAIAFLEDEELFDDTLGDVFGGSCEYCSVDEAGEEICEPCPEDETDEGTDLDLSDEADEIAAFLEERVFTEANLEEESGDAVVYRLRPEVVCREDGEVDEDCARIFTDVPQRLRVTSPDEGDLDIAWLVGDDRHNPATFHLYDDLVGVTVDLNDAYEAGHALSIAASDDDDFEFAPSTIEGKLRVDLQRNGDRDYTARLRVLEDVSFVLDSDGEHFEAHLGASDPTIELRVNGNDREVSALVDLGLVDVSFPLDDIDLFGGDDDYGAEGEYEEEEDREGTLRAVLAGLSFEGTFEANSDRIEISNIGIGDQASYLAIDGETIVTADLNADSGRRFDLAVTKAEDDGVDVSVTPGFDLAVHLALEEVASIFEGEDLASWQLSDDLRVTLDGDDSPSVRVRDGEDALEVLAGRLTLTSRTVPSANVDAEAGMCVYESDEASSEESPFDGLVANACE